MNTKLVVIKKDNGDWIFQLFDYIEDGWYIVLKPDDMFYVYEIPVGGGEPQLENVCNTLTEAYNFALTMT